MADVAELTERIRLHEERIAVLEDQLIDAEEDAREARSGVKQVAVMEEALDACPTCAGWSR